MRILLVEDEEKVSRFVTLGLNAEQFVVDLAADGITGYEMATAHPYDILVVDLMLPRLSGTELISRLRQNQVETPVLVLTARDQLDDKIKNFENGADDYLTKPFAFAELLARIRALLRRRPVGSTMLTVGDLEIDLVTRQVKRGGKVLRLTSKEYGLLEYLASNPGRVLSRTMIIQYVWDQSFEGLTNIVDVYIRHLRQKIDDPFDRKLIRTVRSAGYMLSDRDDE
ncbi:MAG: response regulator transcription factor [Verrucomicrobia bacterium]|nr:response regulator transcription factor [Verrucomicrobiota bacterium]